MSIDDLYAELDLDWRPNDRSLFVNELKAAARSEKTKMGLGEPSPEQVAFQEKTKALLEEIEKETVEFSKVLQVLPLREEDYEAQGLKVPTKISTQLENYKFYLVSVPITLMPMPGWGFVQLDCILEFNPDEISDNRPVAHEVFPKEEWETIIKASQGLEIGLNEDLEFKTPKVDLPVLGKTGVGFSGLGTASLVVGPFQYSVCRPKIQTSGTGNVKVRWHMEGEHVFEREEPVLSIVLKVPKQIEKVVIIGALKASGRFHTFTADIRHLFRYLRDRTKKFYEAGAPKTDDCQWDISRFL